MKKLLMIGLIGLAFAQAKTFVGFDGGYMLNGYADNGKLTNYDTYRFSKKSNNWTVGLNFGAEGFVNDYFGARAFLEALYARGINYSSNELGITGNVDIMINFIASGSFSLGIFGGAGLGYDIVFNDSGSFPVYGRGGVSIGLGDSSRIDFTAKLPILGWKVHGNKGTHAPISLLAGYKYLF